MTRIECIIIIGNYTVIKARCHGLPGTANKRSLSPPGSAHTLEGMDSKIYKIMSREDWDFARTHGQYHGSADDERDGYIHFSTSAQVRATARKHFAGQTGLVLLALDTNQLGDALRWEPSRGGDLFPHLYAPMPVSAVTAHWNLPLADGGEHVFPEGVA